MGKVWLLIVFCGCHCLAQDRGLSIGELQVSIAADMRGKEAGGASTEAPTPTADRTQSVFSFSKTPMAAKQPLEAEVISVGRLSHKVPRQAEKAYERATKLSKSGKYLEASRELERAISYDPDYASAHNNLGVHYIQLHRPADAERELLRAVQLDPALEVAFINLAWLELQTRDFAAAKQHALRAIALSGRDDQARLLLDLVLARSQP